MVNKKVDKEKKTEHKKGGIKQTEQENKQGITRFNGVLDNSPLIGFYLLTI